jgi:hypothetical protein
VFNFYHPNANNDNKLRIMLLEHFFSTKIPQVYYCYFIPLFLNCFSSLSSLPTHLSLSPLYSLQLSLSPLSLSLCSSLTWVISQWQPPTTTYHSDGFRNFLWWGLKNTTNNTFFKKLLNSTNFQLFKMR